MPPAFCLLLWRKLPARKFDAVERPEGFNFSSQILRKQIFQFGVEDIGQNKKLQVRDTACLVFQSRHRILTGIPPDKLQFNGKLVLRPPLLLAEFSHLRADDV